MFIKDVTISATRTKHAQRKSDIRVEVSFKSFDELSDRFGGGWYGLVEF
jgi:hypothetical protein